MSSHHRPLRLLAPSALVAVVALAGCAPGASEARVTPPPAPPAGVAQLCAALHRELPETVSGLARSVTEPETDLTAAWGGSAIVLRCGIPKPPKMADPKADGVEVDGVGWLVEQPPEGGLRFTTTGRLAYTEVWIDKEHATDASMLVGLSAAVAASVPAGISSY